MNNISSDNKPNLKNPVDLLTTNCGIIQCEKEDRHIFQHIDLLATLCWERDNETTSGWEYLAQIADGCDLNFISLDEVEPWN